MKLPLVLALGAVLLSPTVSRLFAQDPAAGPAPRERILIDDDWRFIKGDPAGTGDTLNYKHLRDWLLPIGNAFTAPAKAKTRPAGNPGEGVAFTQPAFDDKDWRKLDLPHDWAIEGPFEQALPGETGKLPYPGVGWYRKHLTVPASDAGRQFSLEIDGAMSYSAVWCNGQFVGGWPYGYASYHLDLTPYIKPGGENVLAIRLDNPPNSSRWYPGGGIYRNVWLVKTAPIHIAPWGVTVTTPEINAASARVHVRVDVVKPPDAAVSVTTEICEVDAAGKLSSGPLAGTLFPHSVPVGSVVEIDAGVANPKLWDLGAPHLYAVINKVVQNNRVVDSKQTLFGIRTIQFTADNGFLLNGKRVPLNGVCGHADIGALGTVVNVRGLQRQIEILKEMGCNAIRTSHNMPAPELLDLCDQMGVLVMDESFDCWKRAKKPGDYHLLFDDWHEQDMRAEVRRDRNHPSVILYSIGNEIPEQGTPEGTAIGSEFTAMIHEEDPTRPTTIACSSTGAGYTDFVKAVDVFGYNYRPGEYGKWHQAHPGQPLFGSETSSTISSRGEYFFPLQVTEADFQVTSYDNNKPGWATLPDQEFKGQEQNPFVAGEFVWTGFDYLGEPTPYNSDTSNLLNWTTPEDKAKAEAELKAVGKLKVPSRSSYFGIVDLCGFKKDRFYLYQARWRPELRMAHVLPHWNWAGREGQVTPVYVYTSGDEAELFLNGKSLGRKKKAEFEYRIKWDDVKYEAGELKVVAYRNGSSWAEDVVKTTGPATRLRLEPDRASIRGDGRDLSFVTAKVVDGNGLMVPTAEQALKFEVSGPGAIAATDNGDATDHTVFQSPERKAFNGMALAIVRGKPGSTGSVTLRVTAEGLAPAQVVIQTEQ